MVSSSSSKKPHRSNTSQAGRAAKKVAVVDDKKSTLRRRKAEWTKDVKGRPWPVRRGFVHPKGTATVTKTNAETLVDGIKLDKYDLATLPYQEELSSAGWRMKLFSENDVRELAHQKAAKLGIIIPTESSVCVIGQYPASLREKNPRSAPDPPVTKTLEYTPPVPVNPADPPPETIIWKGEVIQDNVELEDACFLYLVDPKDLADLRVGNSKWLDIESVARRAVTLHGGFIKHNEMVFAKRRQAVALVKEVRDDEVGDYSASLKSHLKKCYGFGDNDARYNEPSPLKMPDRDTLARTVKQYTPIRRVQTARFTNDFWWFHGLGEPLVEPDDVNTWSEY